MSGKIDRSRAAWALAERQEGVISREQLLEAGFSRHAIAHRLRTGRLHPLWEGVYVVGRASTVPRSRWWGAVLACGPGSAISHGTAAAARRIRGLDDASIHVSVPADVVRRRPGIVVHRRSNLRPGEIEHDGGLPITAVATTLVDIAAGLSLAELERAVNDADKLDLLDPQALRAELQRMPPRPGRARLRKLLDRHTFVLTDSELERRFVPIALRAGLPSPATGALVEGFEVDFFWPELGLVVETDGLRYHRTSAAQARDRRRDQAHAAAGLTPLRFTHAQVRYEAARVEAVLRSVANRLGRGRSRD
jgi:hypothetical protein